MKEVRTVKIIRPFSNIMMFVFFLLGLTAAWTNQSPTEIYRSAKSAITNTGLLSFEQKIAVNHVIRRTEETLSTFSGQNNEIEDDIEDEEDITAEDYIISRAVEKDEKFWKDLN